jgi:plasmid maintenance system antidote protein VapI
MGRIEDVTDNTIRNLEKKTGKTLDQWLRIAKATPLTEQREIVNFLESKCGLTPKFANLIASQVIEQTRRQK